VIGNYNKVTVSQNKTDLSCRNTVDYKQPLEDDFIPVYKDLSFNINNIYNFMSNAD